MKLPLLFLALPVLAAFTLYRSFAAVPTPASAATAPAPPLELAVPTPGWRYEELRRMPAAEAGQAAVADPAFLYAINNRTIGKYRKTSGERIGVWDGGSGGSITHLNAGVVFDGRLYCAHSNFPGVPMLSSIEIFDVATLKHIGSHSLGRMDGSLTWIDRRERSATLMAGRPGSLRAAGGASERDAAGSSELDPGTWIACFVHYGRRGGEPGRGPEWTQILEFDDQWRRLRGWALPADLLAHVGARGYSLSGGAFGPRGLLYVTGHDHPELYVLDFPTSGSALQWIATVPITAEGQAFSWDPVEPGVLYNIGRKTREVIIGRVTAPHP